MSILNVKLFLHTVILFKSVVYNEPFKIVNVYILHILIFRYVYAIVNLMKNKRKGSNLMAIKRVTISDIAEACGLSRNTVSKVFNGRGSVPEATKRLVLQKAQELGYGSFSERVLPMAEDKRRTVALLTQHKLLTHTFGSYFLTSFTDQVSRMGYMMKLFEISSEEIAAGKLPPHLLLEETAGLLCIELFDESYLNMISSLGLPCVLVDGHKQMLRSLLNSDFICMESYASTIALTERMISAGAKRIGFVGDRNHCSSFYWRWLGYRTAVIDAGLAFTDEYSILKEDSDLYGDPDWLIEQLNRMPSIPDGFVCANDFLAIRLMTALKRKGLSIPKDVMVTGFDGSPESVVVEPALTTAEIPSSDIGRSAAIMLISRIESPARPYCSVYYRSTPIFRGTTR